MPSNTPAKVNTPLPPQHMTTFWLGILKVKAIGKVEILTEILSHIDKMHKGRVLALHTEIK